jgi:hypothetical protein
VRIEEVVEMHGGKSVHVLKNLGVMIVLSGNAPKLNVLSGQAMKAKRRRHKAILKTKHNFLGKRLRGCPL